MKTDLEYWDENALEWAKLVERNRLENRDYKDFLITSAIDSIVSEWAGKRVLVAGCGEGLFVSKLVEKGAEVVAVDGSAKMIQIAKRNYPEIEFRVADLLQNLDFTGHNFDLIIANMLFMSLSQIDVFLSESKRVLGQKGSLIISVLHPCFNFPTMTLRKTWWEKIYSKPAKGLVSDYFQKDKLMRKEDNSQLKVPYYHRTIEDYSLALKQAGFVIEAILEPSKLDINMLRQHPKLEFASRLPRFLVISAKLS